MANRRQISQECDDVIFVKQVRPRSAASATRSTSWKGWSMPLNGTVCQAMWWWDDHLRGYGGRTKMIDGLVFESVEVRDRMVNSGMEGSASESTERFA